MYVFGLDESIFYSNIRILIIELIVLRTLSFFLLLIKVNPKHKSREYIVKDEFSIEI